MPLRILVIVLLLAPFSLFASTQFRVIVDASGSMVINDPDRLTAESLRLISDLAPEEETSLGVWLFGEVPRVLLPETIITDQVKQRLKNNLGGYITEDVQTDLEAAIELMLNTPTPDGIDPDAEQHWILVTDGMVDISLDENVNKASRKRILNPLLTQLIDKNIHLHTVSMTGHTDRDLLKSLAVKTNSSFTEVAVPDDLLSTFNRIFTMANNPDELAFTGNSFIVDASIEELTLLVFHSLDATPRIIPPNHIVLDDGVFKAGPLKLENSEHVTVAKSSRYTLVTVKQPEVGEWQVENVNVEKSSIRIVTNLRAEASVVSPILFINEPILSDIALFESGALLNDPVILDLVSANQNLVQHNGDRLNIISEKQLQHEEAHFKNNVNMPNEEGDYELYSFLDGQTFTRKLSQFFSTIPAISFDIEAKEYGLTAFTVKPTHLRLNALLSRVMLEVNYTNGERIYEDVPLLGIGFWQKIMLPKVQSFSARVQLMGVTQSGVEFEYWSPAVTIPAEDSTTSGQVELGIEDVSKGIPLAFSSDVLPTTTPDSINEQTLGFPLDSAINEAESTEADELEQLIADSDITDDAEEEIDVSSTEVLFYVAINFGAFSLLGGAFWWYRKRKKNRAT